MIQENKDKKCGDCRHCVLAGWWDLQRICELTKEPTDKDCPACINLKTDPL